MVSEYRRTDLAPYPVEIAPPDLSAWRVGNTGIDYFHSFAAEAPGPHVMITALVHGNELCGAIVVDELLRQNFRPIRGRLTLGFCNVAAYLSFDPTYPVLSRFVDEDMNRLWDQATLDGGRRSHELLRAREIRPLLDTVDHLLDIHSLQHPTRPLVLSGATCKGRRLAELVGVPDRIVIDYGHAAGRRLRDYAAFSDPQSHQSALLVECGQHWARNSVDVARDTLSRFLVATGMAESSPVRHAPDVAGPQLQKVIEITDAITVEDNPVIFTQHFIGMEVIAKAGTLVARAGDRPISTPYDNCVLIMPSRRMGRGQTAVRLGRFID